MSSCSKAARGLSVLVRVNGIFTASAISPSPSLRQYPYHYAIRAGLNLPDKEFRYLRTVIVTAAVHRGFILELALRHLTFRHWAGVSPYTSAFALARTCVFGKQLHGFFRCALLFTTGRPYPEVTVASIAEFLNEGSLDHLGLLDLNTRGGLRYGRQYLLINYFSGQQDSPNSSL